jgi:hypothetical protein
MSSYLVLRDVSVALRELLWEAFSTDPVIRDIVRSRSNIVFANPTEAIRDSDNQLSLWLYQVTENEFLKNQPVTRGNGHTSTQETPLALNLFYLITPLPPSGEAFDLLLLGSAMQAMYDNAILVIRNPANGVNEEVRIILCRLSLEELTRIWEALREPYRLSVCYQVRVTRIDSRRIPQNARVVESHSNYGDVTAAASEEIA